MGGDTLATFLDAMRPGGRAVLIGYVAGRTLAVDLPALLARDVRLLPVNMVRRAVPDEEFHRLLGDLTSGRLTLRTRARAFAELPEAVADRRAGAVSGALAVVLPGLLLAQLEERW
ncbi:hypothetical protein ACODT3_41870 [Streptomyces sp. 4.24]|uniref:hypothetical protein n=1 Tax=Streptomyces tritrimontium TaxID=3406573 RepID=UPI003BB7A6AA